ncbi:peptidase [Streptococcus pneumoniae]|nr:peptidase [Streptococcus pneumoniae]
MTIEELVDSHGVTLAYFDNELWQRPGVYIKEISIIFINRELSEDAKKTGHIPRIRTSGTFYCTISKQPH